MQDADASAAAAAIEQRLQALVAQEAQQRSLQAESDRLDELLLLANTLLLAKKLTHFAASKQQQPFPLTLAVLPALPSLPATSVSLSVTVTNRTAIPLCTPPTLCSVVLICHARHLSSGRTVSHVHSFSPSSPLFLPAASFTQRVTIPLGASHQQCSLRGEVELQYRLDGAAAEQSRYGKGQETAEVGQPVKLRLAHFDMSAAELCQHTTSAPVLSLTARARALLRAHPSTQPQSPRYLSPQLDSLFSLSTLAAPQPSPSSAEFAIAFLSLAMSSAAASLDSSSVNASLLSALFPSTVSSVRAPPTARAASVAPVVTWRYGGCEVRAQVEARRLPAYSSAVRFVRVRCSSPSMLPAVHTHVMEKTAQMLSARTGMAGQEVAAALRYEERKALLAALFDEHLAPLSDKQAELLSQLRLTQQQMHSFAAQQSTLSAAEVQLLSVRLLHRVSALYRHSRQLLRPSQLAGLDEAVLVV